MSLQRLLAPIVEMRKEEGITALLMFTFSFTAMTAHNAIKPLARSKFIGDLGADNLPYVLLASGLIIGVLMTGYAWLMARLPQRWGIALTQVLMGGVLLGFYVLFQGKAVWASSAFYVLNSLTGVLFISQFWTVANLVYDARQAKRLFGFIGGGAPLGGVAGSALAANAERLGSTNLLLIAAGCLFVCAVVVAYISGRESIQAERSLDHHQGREGRQPDRGVHAAAPVEAPADHRARHQLFFDRRGNHRAAGEHGGSGGQRR